MPKNNQKKEKDIYVLFENLITSIFQYNQNENITTEEFAYEIQPQLTNQFVDILLENKFISQDDLENSYKNIGLKFGAFAYENIIVNCTKIKDELAKRYKFFFDNLTKIKEYKAQFIIDNLELPEGFKIGKLEVINEDKLVKNSIIKSIIKSKSDSKRRFRDLYCIGQVIFESCELIDEVILVQNELEKPFSILSYLTDVKLNIYELDGYIHKSEKMKESTFTKPVSREIYIDKIFKYNPKNEKFNTNVELLSNILNREKLTKLEKKLFQALEILQLSKMSTRNEISFIFIISAFESLLMTESDRDYLGFKIAEKVSFLIGTNPEKRFYLYKLMKNLYNKRSKLVHGSSNIITSADCYEAKEIFEETVNKIIELLPKFEKMEQKSKETDKEGIEDYINKIKFGLNLEQQNNNEENSNLE